MYWIAPRGRWAEQKLIESTLDIPLVNLNENFIPGSDLKGDNNNDDDEESNCEEESTDISGWMNELIFLKF